MISEETIRKLPKVELHDHLDGGLRPETIIELADRYSKDIPSHDPAELAAWFDRGCRLKSLPLYLETFAVTTAVMQTAEALERIAYEAVLDWKKQNIVYGEIRFAPVLHTEEGLSLDEIVRAVSAGMARGEKDTGVKWGILLCAMRHQSASTSLEIAKLAARHRKDGVVGFDIAGAEKGNPPSVHLEAFRYARESGLGVTIHAGEADSCESIRQAVFECRADRIGHGTSLIEDMIRGGELYRYVKEKGITLEMCLSSNIGTGAAESFEKHPFGIFLREGLHVCLSTDNRLMSSTDLSKEMSIAAQTFKLGLEDLQRISVNAMEGSFADEGTKRTAIENAIEKPFREIGGKQVDSGVQML